MISEKAWDELTDSERIDKLTAKLNQVNTALESKIKKPLLDSIAPRTHETYETLNLKALDELKAMKSTLDLAIQPTFISGTRRGDAVKTNQRALLDSTFEAAQKLRLERARKLKET